MKRAIRFLTEEGDTMMEVERFQRERSKFVMEGRLLGALKAKVYLSSWNCHKLTF